MKRRETVKTAPRLERLLPDAFKLALQKRDLDAFSDLAEIDIVFTRQPADRLVEERLIRPDFREKFCESHLPLILQGLVDLSRRFADPVILLLHVQSLSALVPIPINFRESEIGQSLSTIQEKNRRQG